MPNYNPDADWTDHVAHPAEAKRWRTRWERRKGREALRRANLALFCDDDAPERERIGSAVAPQGKLF